MPQANLIDEVQEDWKNYWQGRFKSAITVEWSIPDCAMPLTKVNQFLQPVLAKKNSDLMVELALSAAESSAGTSGMRVNEAELFNQRVRNLIEIPHDSGV